MIKPLIPRMYVEGLRDIPLAELHAMGINSFIFDLDNTITIWNSNDIDEEILRWFEDLQQQGFRALILSNNNALRIEAVAQQLSIPYIEEAGKPRRSAYYQAVQRLHSTPEQTAVVGDQLFTDILGGNRSGILTVLVRPLGWREFPGTKLSRLLEKPILWRIRRRREQGKIY